MWCKYLLNMKKSFYRTDYLFAASSFLVGVGSVLSVFSSYYRFNVSGSSSQADRTAIEADFGTVGGDLYKSLELFK